MFGALGALACVPLVKSGDAERVRRLTVEFTRPLFLGVQYVATVTAEPGQSTVRLFDGSVPVLKLTVHTEATVDAAWTPVATGSGDGASMARMPVDRAFEGIRGGDRVEGRYMSDPRAFDDLLESFGATSRQWRLPSYALLFSSYVVGMQLPGRRATFMKVQLDFHEAALSCPVMEYSVQVQSTVAACDLMIAALRLSVGNRVFVSGEYSSLVRRPLETPDASAEPITAASDRLEGKVALIIGGARGLGAAVARALARESCTVAVTSRTSAPGAAVADLRYIEGDPGDLRWCTALRRRIDEEYGRLDFLVCNAFPPVQPLRVEANAAVRIADYVNSAVRLVAHPLSVFVDLVARDKGVLAVISSIFVEEPNREFPQYVAAKSAVEGLARVAALQHRDARFLIVRPRKLLTDFVNTPRGRVGAASPEAAAASIVEGMLSCSAAAGDVEILRRMSLDESNTRAAATRAE